MNSSASQLQACLEQEIELVDNFLAILKDEAKVLEDGAAESALADTTAKKNTAADALTAAAAKRNAVLESMGFGTDGAGLRAAAESFPEVAEARLRLIEASEQARTLNEANGSIIEVFLDHNQRTLETLRSLTGAGDIYDASGRKRHTGKTSRNIKAG